MKARAWRIAAVVGAGVVLWLVVHPGRSAGTRPEDAAPVDSSTTAGEPQSATEASTATRSSAAAERAALAPARDDQFLLIGRVSDPDGRPLAGVRVLAASPSYTVQDWMILPLDSPAASTESDADGQFRLRVVRGEQHVVLRAEGWAELDLVHEPARLGDELDLGTLTLERAVTLRGTVIDVDGRPVAGARVLRTGHTDAGGRRIEWSERELARSADDGTFVLTELSIGPTELAVRAPGFVREERELFAEVYEPPEWRVELEPAAPIRGRVLGAPAEVELEVLDAPCAADGSFVLDELPPSLEPVQLYVSQVVAGQRVRLSPFVAVSPGTSDVELRVPQPVSNHLQLVDSATRAPLVGVHVGLFEYFPFESTRPCTVVSDAPGMYALAFVLPEETEACALAVSCPNHESIVLGGRAFVPGETHDFGVVALERLATTRLRLLDEHERYPIAGARISVGPEHREDCLNAVMESSWPERRALPASWQGTSATDGTAQLVLSAGQDYWVTIEHDEHAPLGVPLSTSPRPPAELELRLLRGGAVVATCLDSRTRAPLAGVEITCDLPSGKWTPQMARHAPGCVRCRTGSAVVILPSRRPMLSSSCAKWVA